MIPTRWKFQSKRNNEESSNFQPITNLLHTCAKVSCYKHVKRLRLKTGKTKQKKTKKSQAKPQPQRSNKVSAIKRSLTDFDHHGSKISSKIFLVYIRQRLKTKHKIFLDFENKTQDIFRYNINVV